MKHILYSIAIAGILFSFACQKESGDENDVRAKKMEDIRVSENFHWKTSHSHGISLPDSIAQDGSPVYIADKDRLYYKGPALYNVYPVTVPSYVEAGDVKVYTSNPFGPSSKTTGLSQKGNDSDGDGINDNKDDFPNDPYRAFINNYPSSGFSSLIYEDLWPAKGDYDFNDMVIDYSFDIITNASDQVVEIAATFVLRAIGASYHNAFAFELPSLSPDHIIRTEGIQVPGSSFNISANGTEAGQSALNIIVFDNAYDILQHPGGGGGINVDPAMTHVQPDTMQIKLVFMENGNPAPGASPVTSVNLNLPQEFNPYIIVNVPNDGRGREVHLPGKTASDLADPAFFNTADDDSDAAAYDGSAATNIKSYKSAGNYPWGLNIYESFDYMISKECILKGYLRFQDWAEKGHHTNWYSVDNHTYRDYQFIY
ncbi:MAG: LruC domain-containing protein [Bacteroidales bacterium]